MAPLHEGDPLTVLTSYQRAAAPARGSNTKPPCEKPTRLLRHLLPVRLQAMIAIAQQAQLDAVERRPLDQRQRVLPRHALVPHPVEDQSRRSPAVGQSIGVE